MSMAAAERLHISVFLAQLFLFSFTGFGGRACGWAIQVHGHLTRRFRRPIFCAIPISKLYLLDTNDIDTVGTRGQAARASDLIPRWNWAPRFPAYPRPTSGVQPRAEVSAGTSSNTSPTNP